MKKIVLLTCSFIVIFTAGCGPSSEVLAVTMVAQTDVAATQTRASVPSNTPTPTNTPTPSSTPTPTFTPTPIPEPDAAAAIDWKSLNLPSGYISLDAAKLGMGEGDFVGGVQKDDGTEINYYIEKSFVFAEQWPEAAYGWTVLYPTDFDKEVLDYYIDNVDSYLDMIVTDIFQGTLISIFDESDYLNIGDKSGRAWAVYELGGSLWSIHGAIFRMDDIGGWVFNRESFGEDPLIDFNELASTYAQSIEVPMNRCKFVTIPTLMDSKFPVYEFKVEGFYPGEPIAVALSGDVKIGGEVKNLVMVDLDTENANENGGFHGMMSFDISQSEEKIEEIVPSEFKLSILGFHSGCEVIHLEHWPPLSADAPDPVTITPTPPAETGSDSFSDIDPSGNTIPMRLVPAGEFMMGSDKIDEAIAECEKYREHCEPRDFTASAPLHHVELDAFYIDQYEVTNYLYKACVDASVCDHPSQYDSGYVRKEYYGVSEFDKYPVIYVDWNMASAYCEWRGARLPTQAEWEKAARGTDGRTFPWGESLDCNKANYRDFAQGKFCVGDTTEVGSYKSDISPYGIYDMAGNVSEWVTDWFTAYPGNTIENEYFGTTYRVWRGNSWYGSGTFTSLGLPSRGWSMPDSSNFATGFRCVRSP